MAGSGDIGNRDTGGFGGRDTASYWQGGYRDPEIFGDGGDAGHESKPGSSTERIRQAYAASAVKQKDHISAGLLAIFLGAFGVHKFYLGYNSTGFVMLAVTVIGSIFTLGLAGAVIGLIAAVEGIIYLTKTQTEFERIYVLNQRDWF